MAEVKPKTVAETVAAVMAGVTHDRFRRMDRPQIPSKAETDSLYFHIWVLFITGMMLGVALGICLGTMRW